MQNEINCRTCSSYILKIRFVHNGGFMYLFETSDVSSFSCFPVVLLQDELQQVPYVTVVMVIKAVMTIRRRCRSNKRNKHR